MYKENVRISEALAIHVEEEKKLKKIRQKLEEDAERLQQENDMNQLVIRDKVSETKSQKKCIKEVGEYGWGGRLNHCVKSTGRW